MTPAVAEDPAAPTRLHHVVARRAHESPQAPALIEGESVWSYARLDAAAAAAADLLAETGVRPGDRVMLVGENSLALAAFLFAAGRLDAWAVPVNARLSAREVDAVRDHCAPRRIVYTDRVSPEAAAHAARHGAAQVTVEGVGRVALGPVADAAPESVFDDPARQTAVLIYTTGTTGAPKGVMLSHRNLLFVAAMGGAALAAGGADRVYGALPISHIFGLASMFLRTLWGGACCLLVPRFSAPRLAAALAAGEITILQGVPAMYARLLEHYARTGTPPRAPKLRLVTAGGAPLDADLKARVEAAFGLPLVNGYGLTETAATVSRSLPDAPGGDLSAGPPMPGVEVRVVEGDGRPLAPGEAGELWIRGPGVMLGYYRDERATAEALTADGWYRTGDLARLDEKGHLHIIDRVKEIIIRSGFNVAPAEVEAVLNAHPHVSQSAVVGRRTGGEEEVVAFVEPVPGKTVASDDLAAWSRARLAPYKRPSRLVIVERLPAAATGKILKQKLKEAARALA